MKKISNYQVINHGVENEQYFQGCGISGTAYTDVATGIGCSAREALENAMDMLAENDWDTSEIPNEFSYISEIPDGTDGIYHYVSVRVKGE